MTVRTRNMIIAAAIILVVVFLLGFIPQYQRASGLNTELQQARQQIETLERNARLMRARELAYQVHLETARKNYGLAIRHAQELFNHVQSLQGQVDDAALRAELAKLYEQRDAVIADLTQIAPTAEERVLQLVAQVQRLTEGRQ